MLPVYEAKISFEDDLKQPSTDAFVRNVFNLNKLGRGIGELWNMPRGAPECINERFDFLAHTGASDTSWSGLNLHLMRAARPDRKIAVVATARNEGPYLVEWVAHHLSVGFEELFIYTNDNSDGSDSLLDLMHQEGLITLIRNQVGDGVSPQIKAYEHAVHFLRPLRRYEWVAFLDLDEMFIPDRKYDYDVKGFIRAFEQTPRKNQPVAILVHWDWYLDNGIIRRTPGLLVERFKNRMDCEVVKSIVHLPTTSHMHHVHTPDLDLPLVNSSFEPATVVPWRSDPVVYFEAKINHYFHKSFEEFIVKSMRGNGHIVTDIRPLTAFFTFDYGGVKNISEIDAELLLRVKDKVADIETIDGVVAMTNASSVRHVELANIVTGNDVEGAFMTAKASAGR